MLKIVTGKIARPQKCVIYGAEGIGKTTLASCFPQPLFIDTEGGTSHLDVRRLPKPAGWEELLSDIREVAESPDVCRTLVIDTVDWAEQMATRYVLDKYKQSNIESFGYGRGYTYISEEVSRLLSACDQVIAAGMHVVITAHAKMRKMELPDEAGAFDRWELKISKNSAPLLKEWCDMLLFCNYKTLVVTTETRSTKAQGGRRVMYTSHHPCWDAKNRHGLPEEMDMSYDGLRPIFEPPVDSGTALQTDQGTAAGRPEPDNKPSADALQTVLSETLETVKGWMDQAGIREEEITQLVAQKGHFPPETHMDQYPERFVRGWLMRNWQQVVETITNNPEHIPF